MATTITQYTSNLDKRPCAVAARYDRNIEEVAVFEVWKMALHRRITVGGVRDQARMQIGTCGSKLGGLAASDERVMFTMKVMTYVAAESQRVVDRMVQQDYLHTGEPADYMLYTPAVSIKRTIWMPDFKLVWQLFVSRSPLSAHQIWWHMADQAAGLRNYWMGSDPFDSIKSHTDAASNVYGILGTLTSIGYLKMQCASTYFAEQLDVSRLNIAG